jgi:hypothetical protein
MMLVGAIPGTGLDRLYPSLGKTYVCLRWHTPGTVVENGGKRRIFHRKSTAEGVKGQCLRVFEQVAPIK